MVGQPGAAGWAAWMAGEPAGSAQAAAAAAAEGSKRRREEERHEGEAEWEWQRQAAAAGGEQTQQGQAGDWSGWEELAPAIRARFGHALNLGSDTAPARQQESAVGVEGAEGSDGQDEGVGEEVDEEEQAAEETDEQLLER